MILFPFLIPNKWDAEKLFRPWLQNNIHWIKEKYGWRSYTGCRENYGYETTWSWFEVDVTVISETKIRFDVYEMEDAFRGGRGDLQNTFDYEGFDPQLIKPFIEKQKDELAEYEFYSREQQKEKERIRKGIAAVRAELFGK